MNDFQSQYRFMFDNMTHGAFFQDADGTLVDINEVALKLLGLTRDEFLSRTSYHPEWRIVAQDGTLLLPEQHPSMFSLLSGKSVKDFIAGVYHPLRQDFVWLQINAIPMFHHGEKRPYRVFVTFHDITEQRRTTERLAASEERYRAIVNTQLDFVDRFLPGGILTFVNDALCRYVGISREQLLGRSFYDFIHEADRQKQISLIEALTIDNPVMRSNVYAILPDGSRRWQEWTSHAIFDKNGKLIEYQAVGRDITRQKLAEEALEKSERKYRQLHEAMIDGFAMTDMDGTIMEWNEAFRAMIDYPPEEISHLTYRDITPAKWHEFEKGIIEEEVIPHGFSRVYEKEYIRKDGTIFPIELRAYLLRDQRGRASGMWAIIRDISERKRMETALQQAHDELENRVVERTAALAAANEQIKMMSFKLLRAQEQERARIAAELHDQVGQSLLLAKMKLDMLASELNNTGKRSSADDISSLLETSIHDIRSLTFGMRPPLLDTAGIETALEWLCTTLHKDYNLLIECSCICSQIPLSRETRYSLFQAVRELLLNVAKHAGVSKANLTLRIRDNKLVVNVSDSGNGFDQPVPHNQVTQGGGFGLFNVQQRIEQLGGSITIASKTGEGTSVTLNIPLEENCREDSQ